MLEILKSRLPDGVTVVSVADKPSKYIVVLAYDGATARAELPKSCAPG